VAKLAGKYRTGTDEKKHLLCRSEPNAPEGCFSATAYGKMSEKDGRFSTMQQNNLYFEPKYPTSSGAD
jgi:hypothetical protein